MIDVPESCGHCGREGTLETKEPVVLSSRDQVIGSGALRDEITVQRIAQIDRCSACGGLTLSTYTWIDQYFDPDDVDLEILYPEPQRLEDLPAEIRSRYAAMLELRHAPDAFAVRAGRVLEAICADKMISEELSQREQLNALVEEAGVPDGLISQAHLVYTYRNYGGHLKELEVEDRDVPLIRGFMPAASAAPISDQPSSSIRLTRSSREFGQVRALPWIFIRCPPCSPTLPASPSRPRRVQRGPR